MMDPTTIRHLSDRAARKAAKEKRKPYVFWNAEEARTATGVIPFIGDYLPKGWERVEDENGEPLTYFVDSSGFGTEGEPALTRRGFIAKIEKNIEAGKGYGYALIETGQFQVYVGVFKPLPEAHEGTKSEGQRKRR